MARNRTLTPRLLSQVLEELGRQGGKARAKKLTPEERRRIARNAARARWDRAKRRRSSGRP